MKRKRAHLVNITILLMVVVVIMIMFMVTRWIDDAYIVSSSVCVPYEGSGCRVLNALAHSTHPSIVFPFFSFHFLSSVFFRGSK